jgi:hypothetical protein
MTRLLVLLLVIFISCKHSKKINRENSFYIKYNTTDTVLKNKLIFTSRNKVSYFDEEAKLFRIIPINYKTNDFDDMHYFFTEDQLINKIEDGVIMYDIYIKENDRYDSTAFSVKKLVYSNDSWNPRSDMGWINVYFPEYNRAIEEKKIRKLADYIIQTIAKDSYTIQ